MMFIAIQGLAIRIYRVRIGFQRFRRQLRYEHENGVDVHAYYLYSLFSFTQESFAANLILMLMLVGICLLPH